MKHFFTLMLTMLSLAAFSQSVILTETFPSNEFNNSGAVSMSGTYNGNLAGWALKSSTSAIIEVDDAPSGTNKALRFAAGSGSTNNPRVDTATSPSMSLIANSCTFSQFAFRFDWYVEVGEGGNYEVKLEFSGNGGTNWNTVWSNTSLPNNDEWNTVNVSGGIPNTNSYWDGSDFKFRFTARRSSGSSTREIWFDNIMILAIAGGPSIPSFTGLPVLVQGTALQPGAVYLYQDVISSPMVLDALIKIEADSNAHVSTWDADTLNLSRFQPKIANDGQLGNGSETSDRGWVQFSITYIKNDCYQENNPATDADDTYSTQALTGLRYQHYDLDGFVNGTGTGAGYFREVVALSNALNVFVNTPSGLVDGGWYNAAGYSWRKVLGELDEHPSISSDLDVTFISTYTSVAEVRFRVGYEYVKGNGGSTSVDREYGTEFTCLSFPQQSTLPVKLVSFTGSYHNNNSLLNWQTENESNFAYFDIERSSNGSVYTAVGSKMSSSTDASRQSYQYTDNLSSVSGNVFYYRLKMVDDDGKFKYSNVIMIRRESKGINGIVLNPNPVVNGMATVRFTASSSDMVSLKVMDMSGKLVLQQQNKVYEGNNSVSINNLDRLQVGVYLMQMISGNEITTIKFNIAK